MKTNPTSVTIVQATTAEQVRAAQRMKYNIYVKEMGRYGEVADHHQRLLIEDDDTDSRIFNAMIDGQVVGTSRLSCGADNALGARQVAQYDLAKFLKTVPSAQIVVGERFMIQPAYRGTDLLNQIFASYMGFLNASRIQFAFGDCEPHLLNTYQALGFRTYTKNNVNSPSTGFLIPLVFVVEDLDYLRRIGSPLAGVLTDFGEDARVPDTLDAMLADGAAVQSERLLTTPDYLARVKAATDTVSTLNTGLFSGMSDSDIETCIEKSVLITCRRDDRVIKQGNVAKNLNLVLSGAFEVRQGDETIAQLAPGDVFGEIAFFLKMPRTMDVVAAQTDSRLLAFNERTFRRLIDDDAPLAARLLYNMSTTLCARLAQTNARLGAGSAGRDPV
ncbi:MAG: cyclic nucleotide-binding domain-containing protein [Rhodobacteraceae bacterium]|nr:cyclic nucleotide-binding domain-containing protein [Paracoccaceae bacterium]